MGKKGQKYIKISNFGHFILVGLALAFLISGLFWFFSDIFLRESPQVEIITTKEPAEKIKTKDIYVDISGAVINPGVYQLKPDARIKDALIVSGGLSEGANRQYVSKNINLAQKITDGQKIYIPFQNSQNQNDKFQNESEDSNVAGVATININTASISQLDSLWGIGPSRAQDIIDGRPYSSTEEIKEIIPDNVYEKIKEDIGI